MTRVSVLGAGAWGTALACCLSENAAETRLWTWQEEHARALERDRENREFFAGIPLPTALGVTSSLEEAGRHAELLVLVVPSPALRATLENIRPFLSPEVTIVSATKGIENDTLRLMTGVIGDVLGGEFEESAVALSGPSFAHEVARRVPTNLVAASKSAARASLVQDVFSRDWLRIYTNDDPTGVELGGALKNVIAIAAGALDGFGLGQNTRAALITRGVAEMSRLAVAMGGDARTMAGLAGIGDLVLTCTGDLSRNRTLGKKLGAGVPVEEALRTSSGIAEGYWTAKSVHDLGARIGVELPICEAVYSVLYEGRSPTEALQRLLSRPLHAEWE